MVKKQVYYLLANVIFIMIRAVMKWQKDNYDNKWQNIASELFKCHLLHYFYIVISVSGLCEIWLRNRLLFGGK